jgi:hypothetical protein
LFGAELDKLRGQHALEAEQCFGDQVEGGQQRDQGSEVGG